MGAVVLFTRISAQVDEGEFSAVVLTSARDAEGTGVLESIVALRERHPLLWIALYHGPPAAGEQALVDVASVLLRVVWVGGALSTLHATLAGAIAAPPDRRAPVEIQLLFATYAPRQVREILAVCLANTHRRLLPRDVEMVLSTAGRTLRGRLTRAGWPDPFPVTLQRVPDATLRIEQHRALLVAPRAHRRNRTERTTLQVGTQ